jgi:type III restriction enzyme
VGEALILRYEPDLDFQIEAIDAVVDLFEGLPLANSSFSISSGANQLNISELGLGNPVAADQAQFDAQVLDNLRVVQERNGVERSGSLDGHHYSIEMETGTGKTYVYLRTLFELNKTYGFTKFVIVVPSIPIREGVLASIRAMRKHFRDLYNQPFDVELYDSKQLGRVRQFATANTIQILIMNIQAFQKDLDDAVGDEPAAKRAQANIINREQDRLSGRRPIEFIQATHPVVVVDEPQKMESENASTAIDRLTPFCTLRYSATHKRAYNMVYRLGPVEAYDRGLVKRIEVASILADDNLNAPFVELLAVDNKKLRAHVRINVGRGSAGKQKVMWVRRGGDFWQLSDGRQEYADNYIVDNIAFRPGAESIDFSSGLSVALGKSSGGFADDVRKSQIRETVAQHLEKEWALRGRGLKVLSLVFIDKVANYRVYDDSGSRQLGQIGVWFEEAYRELSAKLKYADLHLPPVDVVHGGYFSVDKSSKREKDTRGNTEADTSTYELIMRKKEELLSLEQPLRFIFSHSALREGWDNPNVFQICTLNDAKSTDRKRQEIGRGLRLPVDQNGNRQRDRELNRLTVIANEAYDDFARSLQNEYEEDTGRKFGIVERIAFAKLLLEAAPGEPPSSLGADGSENLWGHLRDEGYLTSNGGVTAKFAPKNDDFVLVVPPELTSLRAGIVDEISKCVFATRIGNAKKRETVGFRKQVTLEPGFQELWRRISQRTRYRVALSTEDLVEKAVAAIKADPRVGTAKIHVVAVALEQTKAGVRASDGKITDREYDTDRPAVLPDILADLQNETDLTRKTLVRIMIESERLDEFTLNPQEYMRMVSREINKVMHHQLLAGIAYEKVAGLSWEMRRMEQDAERELSAYVSQLYKVQHGEKTPYDHVIFESAVERQFAADLDNNANVRYFLKLPRWFKVDTPLGGYNPDWAVVWEEDQRVYLVRETKSTLDPSKRRPDENSKITCAQKHFDKIGVDFAVVTDVAGLLTSTQHH